MKLYGFFRSTATWRVRIGLHHKGLAFETAPVHLFKKEQTTEAYRARNPMAQVPTLEVEVEGRVILLTQSLAILEYLEETSPEPPLLPREPLARAQARKLAEIVNAGIQPLQNTGVLAHVREVLKCDDSAWVKYWVTRGLGPLEAGAAASAGRFAVGDEVSLADACIVPEMTYARRLGIDLSPYPTLLRVEEACGALPAFESALPQNQPDAT